MCSMYDKYYVINRNRYIHFSLEFTNRKQSEAFAVYFYCCQNLQRILHLFNCGTTAWLNVQLDLLQSPPPTISAYPQKFAAPCCSSCLLSCVSACRSFALSARTISDVIRWCNLWHSFLCSLLVHDWTWYAIRQSF